ncbi:hypothetical protein VSH64_36245 [Amycolatopsis rhabdoformis]|uniref:Uncharacterized protein n=1 Tax=Amycolatopsis rhabdoformis TaxID=1448059 RepID=A0ABZ1I2T2_9PSEU|nr:hypothetical protein [Amycolatopsis rhabdoformis]WSE28251.1 hypothetical protein VSH64_36245 [Amycolatopsis rhabdoformis]
MIQDTNGDLPASGNADLAEVVVSAIAHALGFPTAVLVKSIVLVAARTYSEIKVELQGQRVDRRIKLQTVTIERFYTSMARIDADPHWHPEAKATLARALEAEMRQEIARLLRR